MKKLLLGLLGVSIIGSSATSAVACTAPAFAVGEVGQRIMVVTDAGKVTDKSFNESAWNAMVQYGNKNYNTNPINDYVEPMSSNSSDFLAGYKLGIYKKADAIIIAGFAHANTVQAFNDLLGDENKTIIFADGTAPTSANHVISLVYESELSGFAAGFDAAVWATTRENGSDHMLGDANNDGHIAMGTFAGMSSKFGVDNYNWGYLLGIETYNQITDRDQVYFANMGTKATIDDVKVLSASDPRWFSNSFALGGFTNSGVPTAMLENGKADIVFGVAGPQTQDVLEYHGSVSPYVVGVDTDQILSYPGYESKFLSSATKNLVDSIQTAMDHAAGLKDADGNYHTDVWDGTVKDAYNPNWSINKTGDDNLLQASSIAFENTTDASNQALSAMIVDLFGQTTADVSEYWNGQVIKSAAQKIVAANSNLKDKLDFYTNQNHK